MLMKNEWQAIIQQWFQRDESPYREIRQIVTQDLKHSLEDVQEIRFKNETMPVSSNGHWVCRELTGRKWITLTFAEGDQFTFVHDREGVRIAPNPDDPVLIIGKLY